MFSLNEGEEHLTPLDDCSFKWIQYVIRIMVKAGERDMTVQILGEANGKNRLQVVITSSLW
jgi:hypothetical protein